MANGNANEKPQEAERMTRLAKLESLFKDDTIYIHVDDEGNFTYIPKLYRSYGDETITFECLNEGGVFEVAFKDETPGNKLYLNNKENELKIPPKNPADPYYRVYHYHSAIARLVDGKLRVFLDATSGSIGVGG